ncbi:unnamed protein product [Adineta ricciae]|uniref:Uncharacterized protein n=1 Tax=Adineta ricciae TaxID=249248 RepID=A0A814NBD5_ADIRI|nr:unnamed protein product [Adineta ricciae]CAF1615650.1 unnamed protein product [Adineta ricciae]
MSARSRPTTGWSTALSATTRLSSLSNQTAPLVTTRRKLFRQIPNNQKNCSQRMKQSKYDIEELFNLYYSNDIKFDTFQKQIVTGTRIPMLRSVPVSHQTLTNTSIDTFDSKHCVTRELLINNEQQLVADTLKTNPITEIHEVNEDLTPDHSSIRHVSTPITIPTAPNLPESFSTIEQNELSDPPLVKSVTFLDDNLQESHETIDTSKERPMSSKSIASSSSLSNIPVNVTAPPPPSLMVMNKTQKDLPSPRIASSRPPIVTGSAMPVRQRFYTRLSETRQCPKSNVTLNSRQLSPKHRPPSAYTHISIESDMPELPAYTGTQRTVSIPSKCSRYVLVTFPEAPLRYNSPTYVERLLLPERFPTLFRNILHSYDSRTSRQHKTK